MQHEDFQAVLNLALVRRARALLDELDASVTPGPPIDDAGHAAMRQTLRKWEQNLLDVIGPLRKQRVTKPKETA